MDEDQLLEVLKCYQSLSAGVIEHDLSSITEVRQLLRKWGSSPDFDLQVNLILAFQAVVLDFANGPVDDLQLGLKLAKCYAEHRMKELRNGQP